MYKVILGSMIAWTLTMCSGKYRPAEQIENKAAKGEPFKNVYDTLVQMDVPIELTWEKWDELYNKHVEKFGLGEGEDILNHLFAKLAAGKISSFHFCIER